MEEKLGIILHKCKTIKQLKQVHLQILVNCMRGNKYLANKLISISSHVLSFDYANKALLDLPNPNLSSYNTLIKCSIGKSDKIAASTYKLDISSDSSTFTCLLKSFASFGQLEGGKMVHAHVLKFGLVSDLFVMNTLLDFYVKFGGCLGVVRKLFEEMPKRDGVSWNTIIRAHMSCGEVDCAIRLLDSMPKTHLAPWNYVLWGLVNNDILMDSYTDNIKLAYRVFQQMPRRNVTSWNAIIKGFVNNSMFSIAFSIFNDMLAQGGRCKPDETTLIPILSACTQLLLIEQGKWLCSYIEENNFVLSLPLGNALINMFVTTNDLRNASIIFKKMPKTCLLTWTKMIVGLGCNGHGQEALELFDTMCSEGQKPDGKILTAILATFDYDESLLGDGKRLFRLLHQMVHDFGIKPSRDDYHKMVKILSGAGWVEAAVMLIESMFWEPCFFSWGKLLAACKIQGYGNLLESSVVKIYRSYCNDWDLCYLRQTLMGMIAYILPEKRNDPNDVKLMMELLIKKISNEEPGVPNDRWMESLKRLNSCIDGMHHNYEVEDQYPSRCSVSQARTTFTTEEREVLESLHRQIALPDINDPCQVDDLVDIC